MAYAQCGRRWGRRRGRLPSSRDSSTERPARTPTVLSAKRGSTTAPISRSYRRRSRRTLNETADTRICKPPSRWFSSACSVADTTASAMSLSRNPNPDRLLVATRLLLLVLHSPLLAQASDDPPTRRLRRSVCRARRGRPGEAAGFSPRPERRAVRRRSTRLRAPFLWSPGSTAQRQRRRPGPRPW